MKVIEIQEDVNGFAVIKFGVHPPHVLNLLVDQSLHGILMIVEIKLQEKWLPFAVRTSLLNDRKQDLLKGADAHFFLNIF